MRFERYAVYYTPPPGPLAAFGAAWLGWDPAEGRCVAQPAVPGLPRPVEVITETPRRYGLHATVKPPFSLARDHTAEALDAALAAFCAQQPPVTLAGLEIARLGGFLALVPHGETAALNAMAAGAVRALDAFRAPPDEAELDRRRAAGLSPGQEALLVRWGYPYVMEEFRFHITLTGKLPRTDREAVHAALAPRLAPILPAPFVVDGLSLMGEDTDGYFHLLRSHAFSGVSAG
ncbi:DUF1045 domain-containing protein [Roseovarius salinarum]|uniref:DUF1045 domain-containing protein n=1 Tax=Roseovarius salinarum TaxID=1981892 RepID=UPI000C34D420|nr:DUF1045 domain-containing protein [Roseovarius salinarum]